MSKYKFLLFDSDNTLLDFNNDLSIAIERAYKKLGFEEFLPYSEEILRIYESCNNRWWRKLEKNECTKNELFIKRFEDFLDETGLSGDAVLFNKIYFDELIFTGTEMPNALDMIKALSKSPDEFEIHIVTNGYQHSARPRLENAGFAPYFGECFVSESLGATKPMKEYFDAVFDSLEDFSHEKVIVIGDSLSSDIQGANNAGVDSIWLNLSGDENLTDISPTYEAKNYDEILKILT